MIPNMTLVTMRICLATVVILFHSGFKVNGPFAVIVFYILSGYVSTFALSKRYSSGQFLRNRISRLIPDYLICAAALFIFWNTIELHYPNTLSEVHPHLSQMDLSLISFLKLVLPIPSFGIVFVNFSTPLVSLFWTVVLEIILYCILSILFNFLGLRNILISSIMILILWIGMQLRIAFIYPNDLSALNQQWYFSIFGAAGYFFAGVVTFLVCTRAQSIVRHKDLLSKFGRYSSFLVLYFLLIHPVLFGSAEQGPFDSLTTNWFLFANICMLFTIMFLVSDFKLNHTDQSHGNSYFNKNNHFHNRIAYRLYIYQVIPFAMIRVFNIVFDVELSSVEKSLFVLAITLLIARFCMTPARFILKILRN